uniref:Uncharacterized protein n=1 Tax=Oryza rufipogon TaxID=4529 RepID=A0A0E0RBV7_ORYRU
MESLSSVSTIVRIAQEIAGAVSTVSRCRKLANRVQCIGDLLRELESSSAAAAGDDDEATRRLLAVLEDALHRALELVTSCQDSGCPRSLIDGGRMAGLFDEVDGDIDRCLLELGVANRILITRLEGLLHRNAFRSCDLPPPPPSPATIGTETETTVTVRIGMPRVEHIEHRVHMVQGATNVAAVVASSKDHLTDRSSAAPRGNVGVTDVVTVVASNKDKFTVKSGTAKRGNARVTDMAPVIASDSDKDKFTMRFGTATRGNTGVTNVAPVVASNRNKFTVRPDAATRGNARVTDVAPSAASNKDKFTVRSSGATRDNARVTNVAAIAGSNKNQFTFRNGATSIATLLQEPPSNGYGYCPYAEGLTTGESYRDTTGGGPFDAAATAAATYYYFPPFQHMFSEEDPTNAYTIL